MNEHDRLMALYDRAYQQGMAAQRHGAALRQCPFGEPPLDDTPLDADDVFQAKAWADGWVDALELKAYSAGIDAGVEDRAVPCPFEGAARLSWVDGWVAGATLVANGFPEEH